MQSNDPHNPNRLSTQFYTCEEYSEEFNTVEINNTITFELVNNSNCNGFIVSEECASKESKKGSIIDRLDVNSKKQRKIECCNSGCQLI